MKDYYKILGLTKTATEKEIQQSFRHLASKYHPDKNKSAGAEGTFKDINEAYSTLHNPEKRRRYDLQYGSYSPSNSGYYEQRVYQTYRSSYSPPNPFFFYQQATAYRKYSNSDSVYLARWNWGAFLLGPIWAIFNNVTTPLLLYILVFVPGYNWFFLFFIQFMFGYKGSNWAWQKRSNELFDKFKVKQRYWKYIAFSTYVVIIFFSIISFFIHLFYH